MLENLGRDIVPNMLHKLQSLVPIILGKLIYINMNRKLKDGHSDFQITSAHTTVYFLLF